ncbi:MAG: hypothetical protein ABJF10_29840 [Chthoniobacter sp.]|uniref:hypothetical protein n=1 Tax=Chthoniobacter sp. TaxID=2510640 RepID=UPI0032A66888
MRYFIAACVAVLIIWSLASLIIGPAPLLTPPGVIVADEPIQGTCPKEVIATIKGYTVTKMATYTIRARVLHVKHYWADGNELVPFDVALGWGRMSDQWVLDRINISQGNRFYFYESEGGKPIPDREVDRHSSNNHLIAANSAIARVIAGLYPGEIVTMQGFLVNAAKKDGIDWTSSLTRNDSGSGACEVIYVQGIQVDKPGAPLPSPAPTQTPAPAPVASS